ncbi:MAG: hypothetical protein VXY93_18765, partial [Pseudomonadota bacterium]|nr:hypothetical protein [Pseudomonadota bacterium]
TFSSNTIVTDGSSYSITQGSSGVFAIAASEPRIRLIDNESNPNYSIYNTSGVFRIHDETSNVNRLTISSSGNVSITNDIDVDGHTNLDNVSIAGVTTFSNNVKFDGATAGRDVTFIRSSNTLEFATNAILELGNGGSGDCRLFNNGTDTRIINGDGTLKFESDTYEFKDKDNTTSYLNINSTGRVTFSGQIFQSNTSTTLLPT